MTNQKRRNCPACGAKGSMTLKSGMKESFHPQGMKPIRVDGLDGHFCGACGESLLTVESRRRLQAVLAVEMARQKARTTLVEDVLTVPEAQRRLGVSRQAVHKMMRSGRLPCVILGDMMYPTREGMDKHKSRLKTA